MALPKAALDFLNNNAKDAGVARPGEDDDLYKMGILNSLSVAELVSILESECGVRIPDEDVNAQNFQSIGAVERYVESLKS